MIDGIATAGNFDPLLVGRSLQLRDAINNLPLDSALRVLALMNVRYIASARTLDLPVVYPGEQTTIYRNEAALPRAWIVPSARVVSDALSTILNPAFDPRREVILEALPEAAPVSSGPTQTSSRMTIDFLQDTPNTITIRAASDSGGYLVLADTYYPGWRALLDGRTVEVLRANATFRAVEFPAGDHTVEFRYEPDSARIGALISLVTLVILAVGLLLSPLRRLQPAPRGLPPTTRPRLVRSGVDLQGRGSRICLPPALDRYGRGSPAGLPPRAVGGGGGGSAGFPSQG